MLGHVCRTANRNRQRPPDVVAAINRLSAAPPRVPRYVPARRDAYPVIDLIAGACDSLAEYREHVAAGLEIVGGVETREVLRRHHYRTPMLKDRMKNYIQKAQAEKAYGERFQASTADLVRQAQATAARADAGRNRARPAPRMPTSEEANMRLVTSLRHGEQSPPAGSFLSFLFLLSMD